MKKKADSGVLLTPPNEESNNEGIDIEKKPRVKDVAKVKLLVRNMMNNRSVKKL